MLSQQAASRVDASRAIRLPLFRQKGGPEATSERLERRYDARRVVVLLPSRRQVAVRLPTLVTCMATLETSLTSSRFGLLVIETTPEQCSYENLAHGRHLMAVGEEMGGWGGINRRDATSTHH